ncbi:hypothetical protein ACIGJO_27410 [Streptomyces sp. NPDC079020]|uniref:hypothetical protein n=1 Tax=Streptomyces sp. NPDC079020 TaxID=3365722 RepID=UPI0037D14A70
MWRVAIGPFLLNRGNAYETKQSGACRRPSPSPRQCSPNGWEAFPTTSGAKSSGIGRSRSGHDS